MNDQLQTVEKTMTIIGELKTSCKIEPSDSGDPLTYAGVVDSDLIKEISPMAEKYFGVVYNPAGKSNFFGNLTDDFSKAIGGIRKEQTVFRKNISKNLDLYCAFWPWASKPSLTTVRIGAVCSQEEMGKEISSIMEKEIKGKSAQ